mmetsp:Transcript_111988/g.317075  ORF Transcript_111988/g.317075 Transcript_111988/m.317075 type:complete len:116 (+) Transcript_111988:698-1045(+)
MRITVSCLSMSYPWLFFSSIGDDPMSAQLPNVGKVMVVRFVCKILLTSTRDMFPAFMGGLRFLPFFRGAVVPPVSVEVLSGRPVVEVSGDVPDAHAAAARLSARSVPEVGFLVML